MTRRVKWPDKFTDGSVWTQSQYYGALQEAYPQGSRAVAIATVARLLEEGRPREAMEYIRLEICEAPCLS